MSFLEFHSKLISIKRAPWQGGKAPHKPVLLLALADWFEGKQLSLMVNESGGIYFFNEVNKFSK